MTAPLPPAGWYPDPAGQPCLRWWDGSQWTTHTIAQPENAPTSPTKQPLTGTAPEAHPTSVRPNEPLPWVATAGATSATEAITRPTPDQEAMSPPRPTPDAPDPELKPGAPARALRQTAEALAKSASSLRAEPETRKSRVVANLEAVRRDLVAAHLASIPIERLKDATEGRLRLGALRDAGYRSVADVVSISPYRLQAVPGVGEHTATQIVGAARHLAKTVQETIPVRLDVDRKPASHLALITAVKAYDDADRLTAPIKRDLDGYTNRLSPLIQAAAPATNRWKWLFTGKRRRAEALTALRNIDALLRRPDASVFLARVNSALSELSHPAATPGAIWADYEARAPDYYGILGEVGDLALDVAAAHGHIPTELAQQISKQQLDTSWLRVSLRGYQAFGARFALVQRRSILGDEMGLGKTVEAIAVFGHLAALGETHFLVVCPASVLVNWTREVTSRSKLNAYRLHGNERQAAYNGWQRRGGVAVTTFDTLRHFPPQAELKVGAVVVDEAHYVKNPRAKRTTYLTTWTGTTDRVVFLTGTPMENRVDEFRNLVNYLQPDVARSIQNISGIAGAAYFRTAVAPVYLRRNQEDVLSELPERLDADDWVELTEHDFDQYREAVASRNFMAMRRAPLLAGHTKSGKMQRLAEILEESADNGWKVVVFSYFHDVLGVIGQTLNGQGFGPLTGSVAPAARQELVDKFSAAPGHGVLLSQIQAGGTGLNMQAASVVVLTEPQWKPSIEEQAIARCHRMGQVRRVHVHRLLAQDSADQRMLEILSEKRALFNEYVRRSALRDSTPDAVDIADSEAAKDAVSFAEAEKIIIDQERVRLGIRDPA